MAQLTQSTAYNRMILLVGSSDHVTGLASATLTITASKNGAAFATITPTVTDRGSGFYNLALDTTMTNTLGDLALHITATSADPTDLIDQVIAQNLMSSNVSANVVQVAGTTQTARDLGAQLDAAISSRLAPTTAGRTLDVSATGEAGIDWANIGSPATTVSLSGTNMSYVNTAYATADSIRGAACQAAAAGTITLDAGASAVTDYYAGQMIITTSGTGIGQSRRILSYNGATKVATLNRNWATTPTAGDTFMIVADDRVDIGQIEGAALATHVAGYLPTDLRQIGGSAVSATTAQLGVNVVNVAGTVQTARDVGAQLDATISSRLAPTTSGRTLDVSATGKAGIDWANIGSPTTAVSLSGTTVGTVTNAPAASVPTTTRTGALQAAAAGTATLDAGASAVTDYYLGQLIVMTSGTGIAQTRRIMAYNGSTKVATLNRNWATTPATSDTFAITADDRVDLSHVQGTSQTARDFGLQLDATVSSRMATFTLPTNFSSLAITGGGAVTAGTVSDKTGYSLTQAFPTNFASLAITGGGAVTAGTVSDKTGYSLTQAFPTNFASLSITAGGVAQSDLRSILGTALTGTAANIAASFSSFYNVASATGTVNSLPSAIPGAANGLQICGTNAATSYSGAGITATFTGNLTGSVASVTGAVGSVTGNVGGSVASVTGAVGSVTGNIGGNVVGSVASVTARVTANADQIEGTDATDQIRDSVFSGVVENSITLAQLMRGITAALLGKSDGLDTATAHFRDQADTKNRITVTTDADGNRSSVTLDLT